MTKRSTPVYSIYFVGNRRPSLITAHNISEARLFACYLSCKWMNRPHSKVVRVRGNRSRHSPFTYIREDILDGMRKARIGIL